MTCERAREALQDRLDGLALAPELDAHLKSCEACRRVETELAELDADLSALYAPAAAIDASALRAAVRQAVGTPQAHWQPWGAAAAAAVLLLAALGVWYVVRDTGTQPGLDPLVKVPKSLLLHAPGDRATILEAEGARIVAGAGTRLESTSPGRIRQGEGPSYFEVEKNPDGFAVETAFGSVEVTGTRFLVHVEPGGTLVVLLEGAVRIKSAKGELVLKPGEAGRLAPDTAPELVPSPSPAEVLMWMPWEALDEPQTAERMVLLKERMSAEAYQVRLDARNLLAEGFPGQVEAVLPWLEESDAGLRLETILALRQAPLGHNKAREALRKFGNSDAHPSMRVQALLTLGAIGTQDDLAWLDAILKEDWNAETRSAASEAATRIEARTKRTPVEDEPQPPAKTGGLEDF